MCDVEDTLYVPSLHLPHLFVSSFLSHPFRTEILIVNINAEIAARLQKNWPAKRNAAVKRAKGKDRRRGRRRERKGLWLAHRTLAEWLIRSSVTY